MPIAHVICNFFHYSRCWPSCTAVRYKQMCSVTFNQPYCMHYRQLGPLQIQQNNDQRPRFFVQMNWDEREIPRLYTTCAPFQISSPSGPSCTTEGFASLKQRNAFRRLEQIYVASKSLKLSCQFPIIHDLHLTPCAGRYIANLKVVPSAAQEIYVLYGTSLPYSNSSPSLIHNLKYTGT